MNVMSYIHMLNKKKKKYGSKIHHVGKAGVEIDTRLKTKLLDSVASQQEIYHAGLPHVATPHVLKQFSHLKNLELCQYQL